MKTLMYSSKPNVIALSYICMRQMQVTFLKSERCLHEEDLYLYTTLTLRWDVIVPFKLCLQTPDAPFCIQINGASFVCAPQCEVAVLSAKKDLKTRCGVSLP